MTEFNPGDAAHFQNETILPLFEAMRAEGPIHYCEDSAYGPYWSILNYDEIMAVDKNHRQFSSDAGLGGIIIDDKIFKDDEAGFFIQNFISMDQPQHGQHRKAVNQIVSPPSLSNFQELITARTRELLDELPTNEEFDWVQTVSIELTTMMLATLFDFPLEDRAKLTRWSDVAAAEPGSPIVGNQEQRVSELMECLEYFSQLKAGREKGAANIDLLTMMARDAVTKDQLPHEFLGNLLLLIVGGNDTTRNSMSGSVNAFNQYPGELEKLRGEPNLIDNAVSEIIRWQTPLAHMRRTALDDMNLSGYEIKKGDKVVMWYVSGNRDERFFKNPDKYCIDREDVRKHLSFGFGIHRCMGNRLAEMQLQVLWEEILKRFDQIEVVGDPLRTPSTFVKGYTNLEVRLHKKR